MVGLHAFMGTGTERNMTSRSCGKVLGFGSLLAVRAGRAWCFVRSEMVWTVSTLKVSTLESADKTPNVGLRTVVTRKAKLVIRRELRNGPYATPSTKPGTTPCHPYDLVRRPGYGRRIRIPGTELHQPRDEKL